MIDKTLTFQNIYTYDTVNSLFVEILPDSTNIKNDPRASDTEASLFISNDILSTKIYDKRDDYDFKIVNFSFLDDDVYR